MIINNNEIAFEVINRYIDEFEKEKEKLNINTISGRNCIINIDSTLRLLNDIKYNIVNENFKRRYGEIRKCDLKE